MSVVSKKTSAAPLLPLQGGGWEGVGAAARRIAGHAPCVLQALALPQQPPPTSPLQGEERSSANSVQSFAHG